MVAGSGGGSGRPQEGNRALGEEVLGEDRPLGEDERHVVGLVGSKERQADGVPAVHAARRSASAAPGTRRASRARAG